MAIVYSNNVIEIAVVQSYFGRPHVNVWHMGYETDIGDRDLTDVVEDFRDNWQDHIYSFVSTGLTLVDVEWRSLDPGDSSVGTLAPNPAKKLGGNQAGAPLPPNVAALVKKGTASRPRGRRDGRCFLAGLEEGIVDGAGTITTTGLAFINAALDDFYDGISDTGTFTDLERWPVVLETTPASRAPGSGSVTIGSRRVTSITCDAKVSTQRDRLR